MRQAVCLSATAAKRQVVRANHAAQAVELGLADSVGDLEDAVEAAASLAGVPAESAPVRLRRPFFARLADRFAMRLAASIADQIEARLFRDRLM